MIINPNILSPDVQPILFIMITFKLSSSAWLDKLVTISKVILPKSSISVLDNILFSTTDGTLFMEAADPEAYINTQITPEEMEGEGRFGVNARTLIEGLKELSEQPITVTVDEQAKNLRVTYQNGNFNIPLSDMDCWPERGDFSDTERVEIPSATLRNIIRCSLSYCADDDLRPVMNGICFNFLGDRLETAASDGHRLVRIQHEVECEPGTFILSQRIARLTDSLLPKENENAVLRYNSTHVCLTVTDYVIFARLIEGRYPAYNSVIPKDYTDKFSLDKRDLLAAIRRVKVFSDSKSLLIRFTVDNMMLTLKAEDINFNSKAEETVFGESAGRNIEAGLNAGKMIDILNTISTDRITFFYKDPGRPVLFYPTDETGNPMTGQTCLLMPMMI